MNNLNLLLRRTQAGTEVIGKSDSLAKVATAVVRDGALHVLRVLDWDLPRGGTGGFCPFVAGSGGSRRGLPASCP